MNLCIRAIFFIVLACMMSCIKNEFTLEFDLGDDISENYNVTYYATDIDGRGSTVQAVASVTNGKCELNGVTKRSTLVYITDRKTRLPLVVIADRGQKVILRGDKMSPTAWTAEGNDINAVITEWRLENLEAIEEDNPETVNDAVAAFIDANPSDPAGIILLETYFDRRLDTEGYIRLLAKCSRVADKERWLAMCGSKSQMMTSHALPAKIESMVMRSARGGTDTIAFNGKAPGLIFFWQGDLNERKALTDSLKRLVKEFPDTNSRMIADINLDPDSSAWRSSIRRDSLLTVKRLWAPAGLSDIAVMQLKVGGVPYFLVTDREGTQVYRGDNAEEALTAFRKECDRKMETKKTE